MFYMSTGQHSQASLSNHGATTKNIFVVPQITLSNYHTFTGTVLQKQDIELQQLIGDIPTVPSADYGAKCSP